MAVETYEIYQGETGPVVLIRPTILVEGTEINASWKCYMAAKDENGTEVIARREVMDKTGDNLYWIVGLTPDETNLFVVTFNEGSAIFEQKIEVVNDTLTPPFNIEQHDLLVVSAPGIPNL